MSKRELGRVEVLARVRSKQLQVIDACRLMGVSYRQAKRLWKRFREEGAAGLKHRSAGRPSNRAQDAKFRGRVLRWVREKYGGPVGERCGPTLAAEHLAAEDGLEVDAETLRRWMLAAGLGSRERRRRRTRRRGRRNAQMVGWRAMRRRCGGGCWQQDCGVESGGGSGTVGGESARSTLVRWCRWMAAFTPGWRIAVRKAA